MAEPREIRPFQFIEKPETPEIKADTGAIYRDLFVRDGETVEDAKAAHPSSQGQPVEATVAAGDQDQTPKK